MSLELKDQDPYFGSPVFVVSASKEPRLEQGGKFKVASILQQAIEKGKIVIAKETLDSHLS